jgi:histidinol-phosphate/aromatic aminotransferase/cobyric acid decarboxylase-like protein
VGLGPADPHPDDEDNRWLAEALSDWHEVDLWPNANVHFQYGWTEDADRLADALAGQGIGVRPLGITHGVKPGGLRIVAPRFDERAQFAQALDAVRNDVVLTAAS